jgi:integral membrane protein
MERDPGSYRRAGSKLLRQLKKQIMLKWFRRVALAEGVSFLLLLFIAMPLKYLAGLPMAVKVVGWAHGFLFVLFLILAFEVKSLLNKNFIWYMKAFAASVLPFGTFVLDRQLKREEAVIKQEKNEG